MMRPHITRTPAGSGLPWSCSSMGVTGGGYSPHGAYVAWLRLLQRHHPNGTVPRTARRQAMELDRAERSALGGAL